ncbi:MAG: tripartite tricarboxylate transporter substrate binding protein [Pseudomonadota bacterium]
MHVPVAFGLLKRSRFFVLLAGVALGAGPVAAQAPLVTQKPLTIIVGTAPGSAPDQIARLIGEELKTRLRQNVLIESRPGAGGIVAAMAAKSAPADGNTLLFANAAMAVVTPLTYRAANYDMARDFEIIGMVANTPMVIAANPAKGPKTLAEAVELGKKAPDTIAMGSTARGSIPHLTGELLGQLTGGTFRQVSMSSSGQGVQAIVNGDTLMTVDGLGQLQPLMRSGRIRPLAITADRALPGLESIPLAKDIVPGLVVSGWFMLAAPKGTPQARVREINRVVNEIVAAPEVVQKLAVTATYPLGGSVQDAKRFYADEKKTWSSAVQKVGLARE